MIETGGISPLTVNDQKKKQNKKFLDWNFKQTFTMQAYEIIANKSHFVYTVDNI